MSGCVSLVVSVAVSLCAVCGIVILCKCGGGMARPR